MATADLLTGGIHVVESALSRAPADCLELWLRDGSDSDIEQLVSKARETGVHIHRATNQQLTKLYGDEHHQGAVLKRRPPQLLGMTDLREKLAAEYDGALLLILDQVHDPRNFGACLRVADGAGVRGVIFPRARSAPLTATAAKAASGAIDTLDLICVSNLAAAMRELKQHGVWITGATGDAEQIIYDIDFRGGACLVLGNEGEGLRHLTRQHCDFLARIPMAGVLPSLNVATACAVTLFEAQRQRGA